MNDDSKTKIREHIDINDPENDKLILTKKTIGKKVDYKPDRMWFDYQALFDKTRNNILEIEDEIEVENNASKNELAKKIMSFENSDFIVEQALLGETWAQDEIMNHIESYVSNNYPRNESALLDKNYCEIDYNYKHLLGIVASLSQIGNEIAKKRYFAIVKYIPVDFYIYDIMDLSFSNIMDPILQD